MINSVVLMGRLVADPELRTTTTGKSVCTFRIAVDRSYVRQGEQRQADFITCVAWEQTGNFISRYFTKGSMIAVAGSIQTRNYEDKNGQKRTAFEVNVREASFTGSKADSGTQAAPAAPAQAPAYQSAATNDFEEITDDEDLPF
ncbi:MAG: single-stranded DNA-binding protein [Clostridia bacterium]|jgi:single-strand DNA-binding protein|nr:single-stranded DNA-binding protein [Clostridia bacterium]MBQ4365385.1 single-stranded DNA-binding protein [Clostridia bacterium]